MRPGVFLGLQSLNVNSGRFLAAFVTSFGIGLGNLVLYKLAPDANGGEIIAYLCAAARSGSLAACGHTGKSITRTLSGARDSFYVRLIPGRPRLPCCTDVARVVRQSIGQVKPDTRGNLKSDKGSKRINDSFIRSTHASKLHRHPGKIISPHPSQGNADAAGTAKSTPDAICAKPVTTYAPRTADGLVVLDSDEVTGQPGYKLTDKGRGGSPNARQRPPKTRRRIFP